MKKTQLIDLLTTIRGTLVSFVAITMFVALGVGLFLGIDWVGKSMYGTANLQFEKSNAHHYEITFPLGLTEDDLAQLAALDGVDEVEAGYLSYQQTHRSGTNLVLRVGQLPESIDSFVEVEGTLPQTSGELAMEAHCAEKYDITIGSTIRLIPDSEEESDGMTYLNSSRFTVTALVKSPAFLATNSGTYGVSTIGSGSIGLLAWITEADFDASAYGDGKPYVLVNSNALHGLDSFGDEYKDRSAETESRITELGETLAAVHTEPLISEAQAALDKGQADLDDATKLLDEKRAELDEAKEAYEEAEKAYKAAEDALDDVRTERDSLKADLKAGRITKMEYDLTLDLRGAAITLLLKSYGIEIPYTVNHSTYDRFVDDSPSLLKQLRSKPVDLGGRTVTLDTAPAAIKEAEDQISAAEEEIARGEEMLKDGRKQFDTLMSYSKWLVMPRSYNGAVLTMVGLAGITQNLRWSMASLFLIVGLLVCYSAVTRIVHEQYVRIGTKKAMGFREGEVYALFLDYSSACVIIGLVLGIVIAIYVVEGILISSMSSRFVISSNSYMNLPDALLIGAIELALILGATWLAVNDVLKLQAVDLLAGERPPTAKERFFEQWAIWKRMSLLVQTTVNNCINDTRRVTSTLIGVAGCTALIVCAVMLSDNVMRSFTRQYEAISHFDTIVTAQPGSDVVTQGVAVLEKAGMRATPVYAQSFTLEQPTGGRDTAMLVVPLDGEAFEEFLNLIPTADGSGGTEGAWVSEAYHGHFDAKIGDDITIITSSGRRYELPIAGFFEYHLLQNEIVLPKDSYESLFGIELEPNRLFVDTADQDSRAAADLLREMDGYIGTRNDRKSSRSAFDEFASVANIVVVVYLALAVIMAACVLLNLDFMFVTEKKRELTVLMINGYSLKDAKGYIWHDSVVLTALGILFGLVLGTAVGGLTIRSIEQPNTLFLHGISWFAVGIGIVGSAVLAAAALLIALRRIDGFDLTDINRF